MRIPRSIGTACAKHTLKKLRRRGIGTSTKKIGKRALRQVRYKDAQWAVEFLHGIGWSLADAFRYQKFGRRMPHLNATFVPRDFAALAKTEPKEGTGEGS